MVFLEIDGTKIGSTSPTYFIAEAGLNHNGKIDLAKKMIDEAYNAGADAIKFQTYKSESFLSSSSQYFDFFKNVELSFEEFKEIKSYADNSCITFLSTPFDFESSDYLKKIGVPAFKIASSDLTNTPLLSHIAKMDLPMIISTGLGTMEEIEESINLCNSVGNNKIAILHCVADYPANPEETNLSAINTMKEKFQVPIGYSDNGESMIVDEIAVSLGADIIEKHFTLDKNMQGPDHSFSILPNDLSMANEQITVNGTIKVSELINVMNTEFANVDVNVALENGKIQFQNQNSGISLFEMKLSNFDNTFSMSFEEIEGRESSPVTASAVIYDSQGEAHNLNFIFTPTDTNFINWSWKVELNDPNSDISFQSGNEGIVQFNADGSMNFEYGQNESNLILNDGDTELAINIDADGHNGISGLTSFGSISTLSVFELDGRPTGTFENMFIEDSGQVIAQFTNGDTRSIAQLVLASFNNPEGLEKGGQNTFIETAASGGVTINSASNLNSSIISGALEMSNVDLAKEFTDMIISQRGFQASTKVITATDQILQDAINLKR